MRKLTYVLLTALFVITLLPFNTKVAHADVADSNFLDITQNSASFQIIMGELENRGTLHYLLVEEGSNIDDVLSDDSDADIITKLQDPLTEFEDDRNEIFENGKREPINSGQEILLDLDAQADTDFHFYAVLVDQVDSANNEVLFNEKKFSTKRFPNVKDDIGSQDTGFYVSGAPSDIPNDWSFIRGVDSSVGGEVVLSFENDIDLLLDDEEAIADDKISILDSQTNENIASEARIEGDSLVITYNGDDVKPKSEYIVNVRKGVLARSDSNSAGEDVLGQFNGKNINYLFYTEKRPSVIAAYFSPGADYFNPDNPAFRMDANNDIYKIPELLGVHKIGVGVNQALIIQFDDKISIPDSTSNENVIDVNTTPYQPDLDIGNVEVNQDSETELIINFTTNHPDRLLDYDTIYEVTIPSGFVTDRYADSGSDFAGDDIVVKFKTADGFNNAFVEKTAQELNSGILQTDSDNIAIEIPKIYIKELETIHYQDGLIGDDREASNLTNIEVDADDDVEEIRIVTDRGVRPNVTRGPDDRFSATFAGLNSDITDINVTAYDDYGKVLERRSFRLQGSPGSEFQNEYVPDITDNFGSTVSLYELMRDPEIMQDVLEQIPVSELNRIGVFHPYFEPYDLITE